MPECRPQLTVRSTGGEGDRRVSFVEHFCRHFWSSCFSCSLDRVRNVELQRRVRNVVTSILKCISYGIFWSLILASFKVSKCSMYSLENCIHGRCTKYKERRCGLVDNFHIVALLGYGHNLLTQ